MLSAVFRVSTKWGVIAFLAEVTSSGAASEFHSVGCGTRRCKHLDSLASLDQSLTGISRNRNAFSRLT